MAAHMAGHMEGGACTQRCNRPPLLHAWHAIPPHLSLPLLHRHWQRGQQPLSGGQSGEWEQSCRRLCRCCSWPLMAHGCPHQWLPSSGGWAHRAGGAQGLVREGGGTRWGPTDRNERVNE